MRILEPSRVAKLRNKWNLFYLQRTCCCGAQHPAEWGAAPAHRSSSNPGPDPQTAQNSGGWLTPAGRWRATTLLHQRLLLRPQRQGKLCCCAAALVSPLWGVSNINQGGDTIKLSQVTGNQSLKICCGMWIPSLTCFRCGFCSGYNYWAWKIIWSSSQNNDNTSSSALSPPRTRSCHP